MTGLPYRPIAVSPRRFREILPLLLTLSVERLGELFDLLVTRFRVLPGALLSRFTRRLVSIFSPFMLFYCRPTPKGWGLFIVWRVCSAV